MIDVGGINYKLILITETGQTLDVTGATTDLGWEENQGELALRVNAGFADTEFNGKMLSAIAKPNCKLVIIADFGTYSREVARGDIINWETNISSDDNSFSLTACDRLFYLQQSQDHQYFKAGTGTKTVITQIFDKWAIPLEEYSGPDIAHATIVYRNNYLSDMLLEILRDANIKTGTHSIIRCSNEKVSIIPVGSNAEVYHFDSDTNLISVRDGISTENLVTRVKVVGVEDSDGRLPVEAVLDGSIEYGIRQRIYNRSNDDSLSAATASAQEILNEQGSPERTIALAAPDVPTIRKGDKIHVSAGWLNGYFIVESIQHDATSGKMTMDVTPEVATIDLAVVGDSLSNSQEFEKGDVVILNGAVYRDSFGTDKRKTFTNHTDAITIKVDTSRKCPYHIGTIGWVYPNTITKT